MNDSKTIIPKYREGDIDYDYAHLTAVDIQRCRDQLKEIVIAPFDEANCKGVGYNFSLSEMIYSITRKRLVPICRETRETYFYLRPHETVLALSYEYLKVDKCIAGSFHSRVRMTAQGVGSISTTLDPGWKGMLLFSLNNPTRKRIKIILSTRSDGVTKTQTALTLIVWRTGRQRTMNDSLDATESFTLHLDNPPMRIDIWSELAVKPLHLFGNREYQRFCKLVESLSPFESKLSQTPVWMSPLISLLADLRVAIYTRESKKEICTILTHIKSFVELPDSVKKQLNALTRAMEETNILEFCKSREYAEKIDLADREIQYQLLCDQIKQIHELIAKQVPISWRKNFFANLCNYFLKNLGAILATIVSICLIIYGRHTTDSDYWPKLMLAFVPLVISIVIHLVIERK